MNVMHESIAKSSQMNERKQRRHHEQIECVQALSVLGSHTKIKYQMKSYLRHSSAAFSHECFMPKYL